MIKTHFQDDHDNIADGCEGLTSMLRPDSHNMTKSASAAIDRETVNRFKPDKDHVAVHLVAMGAGERYSSNRNHDFFPEAALKQYHGTFVTDGHVFKEHNNKDPKEKIGIVKHSAYNEPMARVELIVWMNKKAAAEECQMARDGKELSFSMSVRLPNDKCNICSNKARHQKLYCQHLKRQLGRYLPEMKKYAYAINEERLKFFDISKVKNRADRIGSFLQYHFGDEMAKAAGFNHTMGGADLAEAMGHTDPDMFRNFDIWTMSELRKAAAFASPAVPLEPVPYSTIKALREYDLRYVLGELSKRACVLDCLSFASTILDRDAAELVKDAGFSYAMTKLANGAMLEDMCASGGCECGDACDMIEPESTGSYHSESGDTIDRLIAGVEKNLGLSKEAQANRLLTGSRAYTLASPLITPETPVYEGVAEAYRWYIAKAASTIAGSDKVSYGTFGGVLKATADSICQKSLDAPCKKG